jgi:gliding motility-associated-like protein
LYQISALKICISIKTFFVLLLLAFSHEGLAQLSFIENKGQWEDVINYKTEISTGAIFLHQDGFTISLKDTNDLRLAIEMSHPHGKHKPVQPFMMHQHAYRVKFIGANSNALLFPEKALPTYSNYFIGNDKSKWAGNCKMYNAITYKNIYPNIDIRYYSSQNSLKYDFVVHPGGNPNDIALAYEGVDGLSLSNKTLLIKTSVGVVNEIEPYSFQADANGTKAINNNYVLNGNIVKFNIAKYDKKSTLVIDPQLIFSSFTGSTTDNWGYTATPGLDGSFYAGGIAFSTGFPISLGAFQTNYNGGDYDMAIFKFSSNGSARLYATYIGGSRSEQPHSMIADSSGNLIVAGRTDSPNYPVLSSINNAGAGYDIVLTKLNNTGTALIGSIKIGGSADDGVNVGDKNVAPFGTLSIRQNYGDDARSEVILDANNNIILASCTKSTNFPLQQPLQSTFGGGLQDGVILKLNPTLNTLLFSSYFGGSGDDACYVAAVNPTNGNLYIGGATSSINLPGSTTGVVHPNNLGGIDGYVTILNPNNTAFVNTTYIGTNSVDAVYGLKFDRLGFPYIMGTTRGTLNPINAVYQNAGAKQYIGKLQPNLSAFIYRTNFGKNDPLPSISPIAFLVDRCENVYVSGWGGSVNSTSGYPNSGTLNLPEVNPLTNIPAADGSDFYFFVLRKDAASQLFGSHFGQDGAAGDHVDGGTSRFDDNGIIYQAICANCLAFGSAAFPTFPQGPTFPWSSINPSSNCNLAAVKIDMNFSAVIANVQSSILGVINDTLGCYPITVNFRDTIQRGITYYWNFDSQNFPNNTDLITTIPSASNLYTVGGVFRVRLISENLEACNLRDTAYINIYITDRIVNTNITSRKIGNCTDHIYEFTNNSTASDATVFTNTSFVWDYGDGSPKDTVNKTPVRIHQFPGAGTYFVTMTTIDRRFCNTPKIDTIRIIIDPNVKAVPEPVLSSCGQPTVLFNNQSVNATTFKWEFFNAVTNEFIGTSTDSLATFTFPRQGKYKYRLIASNPNACNLTDTSAFFFITIINKPVASFGFTPNPPQPNTPFSFINTSTLAIRYLWNFDDGTLSTLFQPTHEFLKRQDYTVTLIAYNEFDNLICSDTEQLVVRPIIDPLLDVPNAFTPGKFGQNGIIYVRGFGIEKMIWKIYNRWGELVFTSTNKNDGWNGFYKNKLQPTDVYTYTLDVDFIDGANIKRTGDITLLR